MEFRELKANEIELRVGAVTKTGYTLLLYKNARVDMAVLDETIGQENWQRDHKEVKGNLYCGIGIWSEAKKQWIWKWDCGAESFSDKEKGESSDSFKRAAFNWGIGRSLYTAPFIWINCDNADGKMSKEEQRRVAGMYVTTYEVENGNITKLEIVDKDGKSVYKFGIAPSKATQELHLPHKGNPIATTKDNVLALQEMEDVLMEQHPDLYKKIQSYKIEIVKLAPVFEVNIYELSIEDLELAVKLKDEKANKKQ